MTTQASPRDIEFRAVCADTFDFPITIHLGRKLAITSWLFRKPKFWIERSSTRLTIEEVEQILAQRANSVDPLRAATQELQQAVASLGLALNVATNEAVSNAAAQLAERSPADVTVLSEIEADLSLTAD